MAQSKSRKVIVVGAAAGGMRALKTLVGQFQSELYASVFIVNHMRPEKTGDVLVRTLDEAGALPCSYARNGQRFERGHVYVAPSDHHMMIERNRVFTTKGARENRCRPAIDPLFRSAAVAHGNRVIGIILTGSLDDGTSGMMAIKRCGGVCIAQDPDDAEIADMPRSVIVNVGVDHCLPISRMGNLLAQLAERTLSKRTPPPKDVVIEASIARRVLSDLSSVEALGHQVPFNCPDCDGVLWEIKEGDILRYRCHTGHAFTSEILLAAQSARIEETLWVTLRMLEERQNLMATMETRREDKSSSGLSRRFKDAKKHIDRVRAMLKAPDKRSDRMKSTEPE